VTEQFQSPTYCNAFLRLRNLWTNLYSRTHAHTHIQYWSFPTRFNAGSSPIQNVEPALVEWGLTPSNYTTQRSILPCAVQPTNIPDTGCFCASCLATELFSVPSSYSGQKMNTHWELLSSKLLNGFPLHLVLVWVYTTSCRANLILVYYKPEVQIRLYRLLSEKAQRTSYFTYPEM
jgi:hypothetical protein